MADYSLKDAIELAEYMANPDTPLSWISADESEKETLVGLLYEHDVVDEAGTTGAYVGDVGCGDGWLTKAVAEETDATTIGIDLSGKYAQINMAETETAKAFGGDVYDLLPELDAFDFIYAINFLQATDPERGAQLLYDSVKDGKYVAATAPSGDEFPDKLKHTDEAFPYLRFEDVEYNDSTTTIKQYYFPKDPEDMAEKLFEDTGFDVVNVKEISLDTAALPEVLDALGFDSPPASDEPPTVDLYMLEK